MQNLKYNQSQTTYVAALGTKLKRMEHVWPVGLLPNNPSSGLPANNGAEKYQGKKIEYEHGKIITTCSTDIPVIFDCKAAVGQKAPP